MKLDKVKCVEPWRSLYINDKGEIYFCCYMSPNETKKLLRRRFCLGNIKRNTLDSVWISKKTDRIRNKIINNGHKGICDNNCPFLYYHLKNKKIVEEKKLRHIQITTGLNCDLNCVMCQQKHISHVKLSKEFYESLEKFLPEIEEISMSGGEFLAIKEAKDFFMNFDFKKHKQVKFNFITNGQLLTENIIKRMIEHCNFVNISIDSGLKETYEEIRKGAKWDLLMKNLEIIAKYKKIFAKKNSNLQIILSFVVMKKNFKEIPIFVRICDKLSFIPQLDWMRGNKPKNDNLLIKGNEKELEMLFGIVQDLKKSKKYIAHLKNIENEIICHLKK